MPKREFKPIELTDTQIKAFWSKVAIKSRNECWPWLKWTNGHGYGVINLWSIETKSYRTILTHRIAYVLYYKTQPKECVLHHCDIANCCNPSHLYDGTDKDNADDRQKRQRGKQPKGSKAYLAKLTEDIVASIKIELRATNFNMSAIARRYGVTQGVIQHIKDGRTWRHVD